MCCYIIEGAAGLDFELEAVRPTSTGEEELQLQLALAMSKEEHDEELKRLKGDEVKLQMAIEESRRQQRPEVKLLYSRAGILCVPSYNLYYNL